MKKLLLKIKQILKDGVWVNQKVIDDELEELAKKVKEMTEKEQLSTMDKARKWADKRVRELPSYLQAQVIEDALYCAYLEGAGIRTT